MYGQEVEVFLSFSPDLSGLSQCKTADGPQSQPETDMTDIKPQTKRAQLRKLVKRKSGASIEAIQNQLKWQPHTIRAEISRLRKQGLFITCASSPKGTVYQAKSPEQTL